MYGLKISLRRILLAAACLLLAAASAVIIFASGTSTNASAAAADITISQFLGTFEASEGATKVMNKNELSFTASQAGDYIQVSTSEYFMGSQWYNKYLESRNTVMLHVKTDSVSSIDVGFSTRSKPFGAQNTLRQELIADGEWHTYFVNFSSLDTCYGWLYGLRITAGGAGELAINHISFEREQKLYPYAGEVTSCIINDESVTVTGKLDGEYAGKKVLLYRTDLDNMEEDTDGLEPVAETTAEGTDFRFVIPSHDGEISLVSAMFIAEVDGVKVDKMFNVDNWRDITENPYSFELPDYTVSALDKGVVGDGYTDDTAALNAAIAEVSEAGGGTVVLPGSDEWYGRRYVVTSVRMQSNVELRLEDGAILWQSWRNSDYKYSYRVGHDMTEVTYTWGHLGLTYNYPLVYFGEVENSRIVGGTLRLRDTGNSSMYNAYRPEKSEYCEKLIHLVTMGMYKSKNIEASDVTFLRGNCYHLCVFDSQNVYLGNITLKESACLTGDGIHIGIGSKNVVVDRANLHSGDDALVFMVPGDDEERGKVWWHNPVDRRIENVTFRHSAATGGNIIVAIVWGTEADDWTYQAIRGLYIYDNQLGSYAPHSNSITYVPAMGWPFGTTGMTPIKNVRIFNNSIRGNTDVADIERVNWVSDRPDTGLVSVSDFVDARFDKKLGYWDYDGEYGTALTVANHTVTLTGKGTAVYQGLSLDSGAVTFKADTSGAVKFFARDALTGEELASASFDGAKENRTVTFELPRTTTVLLGAESTGEGAATFSAPDVSVKRNGSAAANFTQDFADGEKYFSEYGFTRTESGTLRSAEGEKAGSLSHLSTYMSFDYAVDFKFDKVSGSDRGGVLKFSYYISDGNSYDLVWNGGTGDVEVVRNARGVRRSLGSAHLKLCGDAWYRMVVSCNMGSTDVYINGERILRAYDSASLLDPGAVMLSYAMSGIELDNIYTGVTGSAAGGFSEHYVEGSITPDEEAADPDDTEDGAKKKKGCKSSASASGIALSLSALALSAAVLLRRKSSEA